MSEAQEKGRADAGAAGKFDASEIGRLLSETRTSLQRDLREIATELRIRLVYLQAIEAGRLDDLPGPAYASGFLRAYGDYLGLDGEELVARFRAAGGVGGGRTDLHLPSPVEEGRLPAGSILLLAALLAAGAYGGWYYLSSQGRDPVEFVAGLPDHIASALSTPGNAPDASIQSTVSGQPPVADALATTPAHKTEHGDVRPDGTGSAPATSLPGESTISATERTSAPISEQPPAADSSIASSVSDDRQAVVEAAISQRDTEANRENQPTATASTADEAPPPAPESDSESRTESDVSSADAPTVTEPSDAPEAVDEGIGSNTVSTAPPVPEAPVPHAAGLTPPNPNPSSDMDASTTASDTADQTVSDDASRIDRRSSDSPSDSGAQQRVLVGQSGTHQIVLRAVADSWVEVRIGDDQPLLSRVMRNGETYEIAARPGLMLATGNAGGIEILVDGRPLPGLGPMGAVRRNVALDAKSLLGPSSSPP